MFTHCASTMQGCGPWQKDGRMQLQDIHGLMKGSYSWIKIWTDRIAAWRSVALAAPDSCYWCEVARMQEEVLSIDQCQ